MTKVDFRRFNQNIDQFIWRHLDIWAIGDIYMIRQHETDPEESSSKQIIQIQPDPNQNSKPDQNTDPDPKYSEF